MAKAAAKSGTHNYISLTRTEFKNAIKTVARILNRNFGTSKVQALRTSSKSAVSLLGTSDATTYAFQVELKHSLRNTGYQILHFIQHFGKNGSYNELLSCSVVLRPEVRSSSV